MHQVNLFLVTGQVFNKEYAEIQWDENRLYLFENEDEYTVIPQESILYYDVVKGRP